MTTNPPSSGAVTSNVIDPKRPGIVTAVAVLVILAAIAHLASGLVAFFLAARPGELQTLFGGQVDDTYFLVGGVASVFMSLVFFWVSRAVFDGNPLGRVLVNIVVVINLVFDLFELADGFGFAGIVLNIVVLIINNLKASRDWYETT